MVALALGLLSVETSAQTTALPHTARLDAETGISVSYPEGWSIGQPTKNSWVLLNVPTEKQENTEPTVRISIGYIERPDHADAVHELTEYAKESEVNSTFLVIGGWPALQRVQLVKRRMPGEVEESTNYDSMMVQITTAVAAGKLLVRLEGNLPSNASQQLKDLVLNISRSLVFSSNGDPATVQQDLMELNKTPKRSQTPHGAVPEAAESALGNAPQISAAAPISTLMQLNNGPNGELEVAVSKNGQNIVVVKQGGFITSNNGGQTFPFTGRLNISDGDSSIAFGQSGNFYHSGLSCFGNNCSPPCPGASPTGTPPSSNNCMVVAPSTNNGQTFPLAALVAAAVCPNSGGSACFIDQEHIAADSTNAAAGGNDRVYAAMRNCQGGCGGNSFVTCSPDSGATWAPLLTLEGGSDFPRVTVGTDGSLYVVFENGGNIRIDKFNACTTSVTQITRAAGGFPKTVSAFNAFAGCEVANGFGGLDRCNDGNTLSGPTVTVDDTNANHVYVAWANNTAANNESIKVADSTDGAQNWRAPVTINSNVAARRYHPWACATGGNAYVGWYDRRAATNANNDLTDYFTASAGLSGGTLVANNDEFKISTASDPQCNLWPAGPRSTWDSENCSVQPQNAGLCKVPSPPNPDPSTNTRCDFAGGDGVQCGTNPVTMTAEVCTTGNGAVKYGDYNGNACTLGRVYSVLASGAGLGSIANYFQSFVVSSTTTTVTYTGVTMGNYLESVTLSGVLTLSGTVSGIAGQTLTFIIGSQSCTGTTATSGLASCSLTLTQIPDPYTVTASFAGSGNYQASNASSPFTINKGRSFMSYTGVTKGDYHDPVTLSAVLTNVNSAGIPGQTITFGIGIQSCTSLTNASGAASCSLTLNQVPSLYTVVSSFGGSSLYQPSSASTGFTITKEETTLSYTGDLTVTNGSAAHLSGVLLEDGTVPISGRSVTFTLGAGGTAQTCTGTTNASGVAACTVPVVAQPRGTGSVSDRFAGDAFYLPSNKSAATTVYGFPNAVRLSPAPDPSTVGQSVRLVAIVVGSPGLPKPPLESTATGTVTFYDLQTPLGTVALDGSGVATFNVAFSSSGTHFITAVYSGDTFWNASQATVKQTVH